jgi:hypothetical protein
MRIVLYANTKMADMNNLNDRERTLVEKSLGALEKMRSPATLKFLEHYLHTKHITDGGYRYIVGHKQ